MAETAGIKASMPNVPPTGGVAGGTAPEDASATGRGGGSPAATGPAGLTSEVMTVNIGPHHPATHGVLRLVVDLEGEVVRDLKPVIGYVHTGIEKSCEDKSYWKVIPFVERMDYVSYFFQMEAFCGAVERLIELEIPPRAKYLRTIFLELNRIHSHLVWLGTTALDLGAISMLWYCSTRTGMSAMNSRSFFSKPSGMSSITPPTWK